MIIIISIKLSFKLLNNKYKIYIYQISNKEKYKLLFLKITFNLHPYSIFISSI
jgi:hypothetical protein